MSVLYEAEIKGASPRAILDAMAGTARPLPDESDEPSPESLSPLEAEEARSYAEALLDGIAEHREEIDRRIEASADRWDLQRMPMVDRNIARIAAFELLWRDDVPVAVSINEAVEMAKAMSTEGSGRFLNGLLGHIAGAVPNGVAQDD